ncbi:midasin isoform X3 [Dendrobium catenatum]|uniref:midasin isoform X3 n=1 Tax=Dendrobium catenatum TaxID=906689 RepID=UPI0009F37822|nr:midasin isoform X3 [Dendrobium catenatum]
MSFCCENALLRFLARCPQLQSNPKFVGLVQKGRNLSEEDLVAVVTIPFLHPNYTIRAMGCFRPLCRQIMQRAVAKLHSVPNLVLEFGEDDEEIGNEDMDVIDFYVRRRRGLRLHELACLAFCRAMDLAPFLLTYLLTYFQFAPAPFRRLLSVEKALYFTEKIDIRIVDIIRVSYRLLLLDPKVFSELWDWSAFYDLVQHVNCPQIETADPVFNDLLDIRWCVIQVLSVVMRTSDRIIANLGMGAEEAFMCLLRWQEYCQDTSLEKAGWYLKEAEVTHETNNNELSNHYQYINFFDWSYSFDNGSRRSLENMVSCEHKPLTGNFVLTTAVKRSFEMVLMAASQKWPVLLYGPAGSGKTALINDLALKSGSRVLFIHMDEQMDSKSLIGSYVSSDQPGEFKWQPGSLTQALLGGFWVVFEDIDKAPNEIQSIILPLLEGSSSFVTGHGEVISVSERFRLFGTISTSTHEFRQTTEGRLSLSVFWRKVMVRAPSRDDMIDIINARYPILDFLSSQLVDTFERVNSVVSYQIGVMSASAFNRFSLRDLLKWCKRIAALPLNLFAFGLSLSDSENIYQEAVDLFAAFLPMSENRSLLIREIANLWSVPLEGAMLYPSNKPTLQMRLSRLQVGRVALQRVKRIDIHDRQPFVSIRSALQSLERIACSVKYNEPVLLVGETGTGKTTLVQNLAMMLGYPLIVMNLSQQTDVADLLGGYKPTDAQSICMPLYHEFKELFCKTFSKKDNEALLRQFEIFILEKNWKKLLHACQKSVHFVQKLLAKTRESGCGSKRKRPLIEETVQKWESLSLGLDGALKKISVSSAMSFKFVEGAFVSALKSGQWLLLDEVNLAPPETLQRIIGVLDGDLGTLCLAERGDVDYVERHPDFRLFACMNPATDAGKRDLPFAFKSRFTEYFIDDVFDDDDLILFVNQYLGEGNATTELSNRIVRFYKSVKKESEERLQDGANQKPQFSLRSLARALNYTKMAEKRFGFKKALYDGFCMFFLTLLDAPSAAIMHDLILSNLLSGGMPHDIPFNSYFSGDLAPLYASQIKSFVENYVLTNTVKVHLKNLARAFYIKRYPVLLQGPTSSGKTSLVQYLASVTGHEFVRINNHEHTDLQEYFGSYITDSHGRLQFQEGVLLKAVRKGYWIVLDELNLAPSDVLEALNRLLDDNRELFVPELQETISAHPDFMLFATQNPPTIYGGRKMLSRAFRNRFLEIHVDEIPDDELTTILEKRCCIPASYASRMVEVMKDLQLHRQSSKVFAGKHGFITPRDLFRWANRFRFFGNSYEDLAKDGYFLLAERLREENEKNVVREVLERRLNVKLLINDLYKAGRGEVDAALKSAEQTTDIGDLARVTWTQSLWKLYFLVERCYRLREPVLLVGDTGGGKTTVCQLLSIVLGSRMHILNCHQYTETSDFVGGFHPVRERPRLALEFRQCIGRMKESNFFLHLSENLELSSDISQASLTLCYLNKIEATYNEDPPLYPVVTKVDFEIFEKIKLELLELHHRWQTIFIWQDGPLVQAMKAGDLFLVDEISLADDSVLERLNSVLEPERKLLLAEKGGSIPETITAHPNFFILATMNPGGDYGKKELSPALRNRFTEIWVPPVSDVDELKCIAFERLYKPGLKCLVNCMLNFWQWFNMLKTGRMLTVRDLLSWISFINMTEGSLGSEHAFLHGAFLVMLDGLSVGTGMLKSEALMLRESSLHLLIEELKVSGLGFSNSRFYEMDNYGWGDFMKRTDASLTNNAPSENIFGIDPFFIDKGQDNCKDEGFEFRAPTTHRNILRVLRAMQLPRPVLLEGSPGVGKTSLVIALAQHSGHTVVRINLSEQTDMMDLLGSDLPVETENRMEFCWVDGILLQALKNGYWVLLDELNLAPQSVLEGLNAILDHRAEVYIPELGITFKCAASFRIFACQNPSSQGGGRKGLPKSFLNRFTKVHVDELAAEDYLFICQSRYPSIPSLLLSKLITFNTRLYEDTMVHCKYGQDGSPWEFNLRDVIRSCEIIQGSPSNAMFESFLNIVYLQRMRSAEDRREVLKVYEEVFGLKPSISQFPEVCINPQYLVFGSARVERNHCQPTKAFKSQLNLLPGFSQCLEAITHCVQRQWLCILVGPSSSGKTSVIRLLAQLTGNVLNELNLSSGTDVSELLGCFEQYNSFRNYKALMSQIERYVDEYFSIGLETNWKDFIHERKSLFAKWFSFFSSHNPSKFTSSFASSWMGESSRSIDPLVDIIKQLQHDLNMFSLPVSYSCTDLDKSLKVIQVLHKNRLVQPSAKFEWVTGNLVKAIELGEWVVLDNANLCNPTVLDRINSLVEPNGSITINECGLVDGKPLVLDAHSRFRMFITIDPKYGEVSRAMRNRGIEIFMLQPEWLPVELNTTFEDMEVNSVKRFLTLSGIPMHKMVLAMSEAHLSARTAGLNLGVRITLLELARWVQLFQQLIMNGNDPMWSLQLSWEHTYLAALGELGGIEVVTQGKISYLSDTELYRIDPLSGCSLSLAGGWPLPYTLKNFVHYSRESCVQQNFLYLEFLSSQCASYCVSNTANLSSGSERLFPAILPVEMLNQHLFPKVQHGHMQAIFDLVQANQMLFFAANWTIEHATESDLDLYIGWFRWYHKKLQPYCCFFESFCMILEQERDHPIWKCIRKCRMELLAHNGINIDMHPIPLLSLKLVDFSISDSLLLNSQHCLINAIHCVSLLRRTYQQWNTEIAFSSTEDTFKCAMQRILFSLRQLESEVLNHITNFNDLFHEYLFFVELHTLFWENVQSSHFEHLPTIWSWLKKKAIKFQPRFPEAVGAFLVEGLNLKFAPGWKFDYTSPTLWVHGGHPFIPSSSDIFYKLKQITGICEAIWQTRRLSEEIHEDENSKLDAIISTNTDLRRLATEGVSMSIYIATKCNQYDDQCLCQLNEIYLSILSRFENERRFLESNFRSAQNGQAPSARCLKRTCCVFASEILCRKSCFDSWLVILLLLNRRSLSLDINLLLKLSNTALVDAGQALPCFSDLLQHALDYSLDNSSRSPADFSPHQTFLWIFDAGGSIDSVHPKISSLILEMWFRWHSSLWNCFSERAKSYPMLKGLVYELFPTRIQILGFILQGVFPIKDFDVNCLKLRALSRALWQDSPLQDSLINVLLSSANCLFKQILFVHEKHFDKDVFAKIKSILFELTNRDARDEELQSLRSLILSSNHALLSSLMESVIQPLLEGLYMGRSSNDFCSLGQAWVHLGILRFHLLLNPDGHDPVAKSALKHSWILRRMSLLELEKKVRRECELLSQKSSDRVDERIRESQDKLEMEEKRARAKVVFRPEPSKYKKLKLECTNFLELLVSCSLLLKTVRCNIDIDTMIEMEKNWQVTAKSFINRLSEDFAEYIDLVQPIQVAVYEIKLGMSLVISGVLEREYLKKIGINKLDTILPPLCSLMQFPKVLPVRRNLITLTNLSRPKLKACENTGCERLQILDINLLNSLIVISNEQQSIICHIAFLHIALTISSSLVMDKGSFLLLNEIFRRFSSFWMGMKSNAKASKEEETQYYKFRPRSITLDDVVNGDISSFGMLESGGDLSSEWQELLMEQEFSKVKESPKEVGNVEEDWSLIPDSILRSLVKVHDQLFGSGNLLKCPGVCLITDEERLLLFMDSYRLGTTILEGFQSLTSSIMDDSLLPEHLLRVCLAYQWSSGSKSAHSYNVYKDSNADVMFKMVEPLTAIQSKVKSFLVEWPDHPGLMKIMEITETLLDVPPCTPLSKALPGLQLLAGKIHFLQENDSRFFFKDEMQLLYTTISSWQKLEVDSWPTLLDGVSEQHEVNATKLWFPLYGVLHRSFSGDAKVDDLLTIQSVEEFICTSTVGEFKKRLFLLLAFHGQLKDGIHLQVYSSPHAEENLKILYNTFGYYVQFLPRVLEHIEAGKGSVEKDLKEYLKLFSWEHPCARVSIENFRRTRQKIWKLIQKFNVVLQEPVMVVLNEEAKLKRQEPVWLEQNLSGKGKLDVMELQFPIDLVKLRSTERFLWFGDWKNKTNSTFENFYDGKSNRLCISSEYICKNLKVVWDEGWNALERICQHAAGFSHVWKQETRNLRKRRALSDFLQVLEKCGLSRHKLVDLQEHKSGQPSSSFLQPSYDMQHLLVQACPSSTDASTCLPNKAEKRIDVRCAHIWEVANRFYFKSLSMIQQLYELQTCFSKDLTLELVNHLVSYIEHLVVIQRDQRSVVYYVSEQLKKLWQQCYSLGSIGTGSHCSLSAHQYLIWKHMWQQKDLFDSFLSFSKDMKVFLLTVKKCHMDACNKISAEADVISAIFDKFVPLFMQSKDELDCYLLGSSGVVITSNTYTPSIVSMQMEEFVRHNYHIINTLEEAVHGIQKGYPESIKDSLLNRLKEIINEGNKEMTAFNAEVEANKQKMPDDHSFNMLSTSFFDAFERTHKAIIEAFGKIDPTLADQASSVVFSMEEITSWKNIFKSYMANLHLDQIHDGLLETITAANHLVECAGIQNPELCSQIGIWLKRLHLLLKLLLEFCEGILFEFLDAHRTIAEMTNVLAYIFTLLLYKGFGAIEDQTENTVQGSRDCSGTGMGEGEGVNDVSDQIEDEAQLTGTSEKDVPDGSEKVPTGRDRGIEMDEDFAADSFSVSEDSESYDDGDDGEDLNIESKVGETGDTDKIVDEKLWDKESDAEPENSFEKYQSGPSVEEMDTRGRELRAKQEDTPAVEESDQCDKHGSDGLNEEQKDSPVGENNVDDMILDENAAVEDQTGIQSTKQENFQEDNDMEETQGSGNMDEGDAIPDESDKEIGDDDLSNHTDHMDEENAALAEEGHDTNDNPENKDNKNVELETSIKVPESDKFDSIEYPQNTVDMVNQLQAPFSVNSSLEPAMCWSDNNCSDMNNCIAPSSISKDEHANLQVLMPNSSDSSKLAPDKPQPQSTQGEAKSRHLKETNPFRSIGQALENWKEKVAVLDDLLEEQFSNPDYMNEGESATEFRYVSEGEKSTSQALGPATADQIKNNVDGNKSHEIQIDNMKEHHDEMKEEHPETKSLRTANAAIFSEKHIEELPETAAGSEAPFEGLQHGYTGNIFSGDVVSFRSSYINEKILPLVSDVIGMDLSRSVDNEQITGNMNQKAIADWRRYELATTRLSQELAEQLRVVLEPTLASRLQGDYKTGKRINMKKVIPYIASHFRRDKIWLRRTKLNKRDYQVVIAIDDSRSMSEGNCSNFAIEALVTVCRAMSQVEVGQFAVASFGEKGNITLLHDFNQPFSGEAGVNVSTGASLDTINVLLLKKHFLICLFVYLLQMISSLSFQQDNTITDEPVVDLLKYLTNMLDAAVIKARSPSGQNPIHQLILIIADGKFHEKENLRRCVRNVLNRKRMIAFILLDSPQESITDLMEACFEGQTLTFKKYLNAFPFPYYIVLKNIEALPRTLADLLRQWFELMQSMGE